MTQELTRHVRNRFSDRECHPVTLLTSSPPFHTSLSPLHSSPTHTQLHTSASFRQHPWSVSSPTAVSSPCTCLRASSHKGKEAKRHTQNEAHTLWGPHCGDPAQPPNLPHSRVTSRKCRRYIGPAPQRTLVVTYKTAVTCPWTNAHVWTGLDLCYLCLPFAQ